MSKSNPDGRGKRPRDPNQFAKWIVEATTEPEAHPPEPDGKNPAAVSIGRLGGLKGGKARAKALTAKRRKEIATAAAKRRWKKRP